MKKEYYKVNGNKAITLMANENTLTQLDFLAQSYSMSKGKLLKTLVLNEYINKLDESYTH